MIRVSFGFYTGLVVTEKKPEIPAFTLKQEAILMTIVIKIGVAGHVYEVLKPRILHHKHWKL